MVGRAVVVPANAHMRVWTFYERHHAAGGQPQPRRASVSSAGAGAGASQVEVRPALLLLLPALLLNLRRSHHVGDGSEQAAILLVSAQSATFHSSI